MAITVRAAFCAALLTAAASAPAAAAPVFILNDTGGVGSGTDARDGFEAAASLWSGLFADDVTIRLDVGFKPLGTGILAQAGSSTVDIAYSSVRSALASDVTSANDQTAVSTLPTGSTISFKSNEKGNCATGVGCAPISSGSRSTDDDNTRDNNFLEVNTTTAKALGLRSDNGTRDASITFSTAFSWDFDPSDGITEGSYDFIGIAAHEIGHALGFVSGVDLVDYNIGATGLDNIAWGTPLDLYRYKSKSRDWTVKGTPCTKVNGSTCLGKMSTGVNTGDGRQASHWKDNLGLGIMDPTAGRGELLQVTDKDLAAFDIIGWDIAAGLGQSGSLVTWASVGFSDTDAEWHEHIEYVWDIDPDFAPNQAVPAPAAGLLLLAGLGALAARRRRA